MTGPRFRREPEARLPHSSISMTHVLELPEAQRQIMVWMLRNNTVTLAEIAQHLGCFEAEAQSLLDALIDQGFVQMIVAESDGMVLYQAQTIQRQRSAAIESTEPLTSTPLAVILNTLEGGIVSPGTTLELSVTITNKGDRSAVIDVFLDDLPTAIYPWVVSPQERLALGANQSGEVVFQFQVPTLALPGRYPYTLVVDAPQHYPNSPPLRYEQDLQVLPAAQEISEGGDPTFFLVPATRSSSPVSLAPGDTLEIQVWVHNRSNRVDRFRLRCNDLPLEWVAITYPQGFQQPGLTLVERYLDLNPGEQGTILLMLIIPLDALAGSYVGTLQLQSENQPDLAMLDLLYLTVRPVYQVIFNFRMLVSRVQEEAGVFVVQASNQGNTARSLQFQVLPLDGGDLCTYTLEPAQLHLTARQTQTMRMLVQPNQPRKRPWFGGGRLLNFAVEVQDLEQLPLPEVPIQGYVLWESRPWWQLLPLVLLGIGALATLVWLIWWMLFRPPVVPQVVRLNPSDSEYAVSNDDAVRLDFQINNPNRVQSLEIWAQSPDGKIISGPVTYDLSKGLPPGLAPFCSLSREFLTCRNLLTDARQPGEYLFSLTAFPKPGRGNVLPQRLTAPKVAIAPYPQPQILSFTSTRPVYPEPPPPATNPAGAARTATPQKTKPEDPRTSPYGIRLNWRIANPEQVATLQIAGRDPEGTVVLPPVVLNFRNGIPEALKPFCTLDVQLVCQNLQTGVRQAGSYIFDLTVTPAHDPPEAPITRATSPIRIDARPPQILRFLVNGAPMQPKYIIPVDQGQPLPNFVVAWQVEANPGTTVSLLPAPGNVAPQGSLPIPLSPEPGSTVITLQVTNRAGAQLTRSFTLETFDPTPGEPAAGAAGAAGAGAAGAAGAGAAGAAGAAGSGSLTSPRPSRSGTLAPSELPPQF